MASIKIYSTRLCPFCYAAKALLSRKGVSYDEIDVTFDRSERAKMTELAGGRTSVPQIWIGERHVGGFDDLNALETSGELDPLLAGA
ncbi:MAG: glutaredoxin 3 [Pseudomonadota bacterium]